MYLLESNDHTLIKSPYSDSQLRKDNPNVSFPKQLDDETRAEWNMFPVVFSEPPAHDPMTHRLVQGEPAYNESTGQWEVDYTLEAIPEEEVLPAKRQELLTQVQQRYNELVWQKIPYGNSAIQLRNETDEKLLMRKAMQAMNGSDAMLILEDNSATVIPAAEFVTLMTSLDNAIDQLKLAQRNIKNQIEAATTLAELEAIDLGPFT